MFFVPMTTFQVLLQQEDSRWIARNIDLGVTSQWMTVEEALHNIQEATELYLE